MPRPLSGVWLSARRPLPTPLPLPHPHSHRYVTQRMPLTEDAIWSHTLQILAAVHAAHLAGLAVRTIDLDHVLLVGKESIRLTAAGIADIVRPDSSRAISQLQHEDLLSVGRLLINLCCGSSTAASSQAVTKSMSYVSATYSAELNQLLMLLLSSPHPTVHEAVSLVSGL